jgi:hypothetical protein
MPRPQQTIHDVGTSPLTVEISISVDRGLVPRLRAAAAVRDITVERLVASVVEVVAQDRLFNAVLDDDH